MRIRKLNLCVYIHANPKVEPVLDTNIATRIVNGLLIPNNINPNPTLVIRPCVNGIRPDSSLKAIHSRLSTTQNLTPMFRLFKIFNLQP